MCAIHTHHGGGERGKCAHNECRSSMSLEKIEVKLRLRQLARLWGCPNCESHVCVVSALHARTATNEHALAHEVHYTRQHAAHIVLAE